MEITSYEPGTPSWVDIGVPDIDAAVAFYGSLFGWSFTEGSEETGGYRNAQLNGKMIAGFGPQMNPGPPAWNTYVSTDSADDTAAKVTAAGGQVLMPPMDVMEFGRMAVFMDPQGAAFSCWQPDQHIGAELVNEPGAFCWNELSARDVDKALAFYPEVFGWSANTSTEGPFPYTEWQLAGRSVGAMMPTPPMVPADVPSHWLTYFAVQDCDASAAKAVELGATQLMPAMDVPVGRFTSLSDPFGAFFAIIALADDPS